MTSTHSASYAGIATAATATAAKQGLPFVPCRHVSAATVGAGGVVPVDVVDGVLYGRDGTTLKSATSEAGPWTTVHDFGGTQAITAVRATGDGEVVVAQRSAGVWKSSGWATNPATATWTKVLATNAPVEQFGINVDANSGRVGVTTYISGGDMSLSRYIWLSTDNGATFSVIYDKTVAHPEVTAATSHMHHISFDPYWDGQLGIEKSEGDAANPRIWAVWHKTSSDPTDSSDPKRFVMFSDNDGGSWTEYTTTDHHGVVAIATPAGMVMDTDFGPVGPFLVSRAATAGAMTRSILHRIRTTTATIETGWGWGMKAIPSADGKVLVAFRSNQANLPSTVIATDGIRADRVLTIDPTSSSDAVDVVAFTEFNGRLLLSNLQTVSAPSTVVVTKADSPARGATAAEDNGIGGGTAKDASVAVGKASNASNFRAVAVGHTSTAARDSVAVGQASAATITSTAVGAQANAGQGSTVVGQAAAAAGSNAVAVGMGAAAASGSVAVGQAATATTDGVAVGQSTNAGTSSTAIGDAAAASGSNAVAVGQGSTASSGAVGVGQGATASGTSATAIGKGSSAGGSSVAVGESANATAGSTVVIGQGATAASNGVAVGQGASTTGSTSTAVGKGATAGTATTVLGESASAVGSNAVSIGQGSSALSNGTAVGQGATTTDVLAAAFGRSATAGASSTAVGNSAAAGGSNVTAVGQGTTTTSNSTAVGQGATATGTGGSVAIGKGASAVHVDSVAIGLNTATTAASQVMLGARHVALKEITAPGVAGTDGGRLFLQDNGAGKTQLCVIFQTGSAIVLATEA